MKCQRCGEKEVRQEGILLEEARGPDATQFLVLRGKNGLLTAKVCGSCAEMLRGLGWLSKKG